MIGRSRRRFKRRSSLKSRGRGIRRSRLRDLAPILKIGAIVLAAAGVIAVLVIFVILPLFKGKEAEPVAEVSATATPKPTPVITGNISEDAQELAIQYQSINDPYINGTELVFTSGVATETSPDLNSIVVFDMATNQTTTLEGVTKKYESLFEPKINDKYAVYLDCKSENGGAVCGYDRTAKQSFVMREYLLGKPKVSLSGDYALWLQQTLGGTDKLYLYYLPTRECATIEIFINTDIFISTPHMSGDFIVYMQPEGESQVLDSSSSSTNSEICVISLKDKGDSERVLFCPGVFVYEPMIDGDNIVFLNGAGDESSSLMYVTKQDDGTYSAPREIAQDVLNYCIGEGYVAYTKDETIYVYYFKDGSSGRLSSENTKAVLACANGKDVIWYDITGGFADIADVVIHIQVP